MGEVLPLLALRAFTEVGRCGSAKGAADVMGVTPGAISQQIRLLEERLGTVLFERGHRTLQLSDTGARAHAKLALAFDQIGAALVMLEEIRARQTLTISTAPSFAATWLVPRLGRFTQRHPEIEVRVEATSALVDLQRDRVDVALRHGLGNYSNLNTVKLMAPVLLPVASPAMLAVGPKVRSVADCLQYPLLQDSARADWLIWLRAHGVCEDPRAERGPSFEDDLLLIRAAEAGQGIALVRDVYVREEIARGLLAVVVDQPWPTKFAYYAVTTSRAAERFTVVAFLQWVSEEAANYASSNS